MHKKWVGIDFGAKNRRTTAYCWQENALLHVELCPAKIDVDAWLYQEMIKAGVQAVFIDAPLSLPKIYFDPEDTQSTHHYRRADIELKAMSPLFLGGLTARAIALASKLKKSQIACYETYPKAVRNQRFSGKERQEALVDLQKSASVQIENISSLSVHAQDSVFAWFAGYMYMQKQSLIFGRQEEGQIFL